MVATIATREDWIDGALAEMHRGGFHAVRVERIAVALGVTKGSFYWHFRDRRELLEELLRIWERETDSLIAAGKQQTAPVERVLRFFQVVAEKRGTIPDAEFFSWARHDSGVRRRAAKIEAKRIGFIREELLRAGLDRPEAGRRAQVGYLATLGWIERAARHNERTPSPPFRRFTEYVFKWLFRGTPGISLLHRVRRRNRKARPRA